MTPKKEAFQLHARRAARAVNWIASLMLLLPIALALLLVGYEFTKSSSFWIGIPSIAVGVAILSYALWYAFIGRNRFLTCPICGSRGRITKREWDYYFQCAKCGRSASTGAGVSDQNSQP